MATVPIRHRMRINVNLEVFTDELHTDVGAAAVCLAELYEGTGHDYFSGEDLVIRTEDGGGGDLLQEGVHYALSEENTLFSTRATNAAGIAKTIYKKVQITDPTYQTGDLYFSGKYFGDYADPKDLNNVIIKTESSAVPVVIGDINGNRLILFTTGAGAILQDIPSAVLNPDVEIECVKIDTGTGHIALTPYGAETMGLHTLIIISEYLQRVKLKSDGTNWQIVGGNYLIYDTGGINCSDYTDRHLGDSNIVYDGKGASPFTPGELVREATSNNTGIVISDSGAAGASGTLVIKKVTGTGIWTNDRVITGLSSGVTANVNTPDAHATTINDDSNIYHGFGKRIPFIDINLFISTDNISWINVFNTDSSAARGFCFYDVDTNNCKIQMHDDGLIIIQDDGTALILDTENYYYRVIVKIPI